MPSWELFLDQPSEYRDSVLPPAMTRRISVEAGATLGWHRFVGLDGLAIGIDRFGASAPGDIVLDRLGISVDAVVTAATAMVG